MEPLALSLFVALAIVAILRRPGTFAPVLAVEARMPGTRIPDEDDDQMPETDRAPRTHWLPYAVASVAAVRIAMLVALHA
ncbi:MAG TPA: hypothetical protein VFQ39_12505 [Longimicrobium sp.]|nr:hypothetical protein [Longimicrobium sp.]